MEALFIPVSLSEYIIILFVIVFSEFKILRHHSLESLDSNSIGLYYSLEICIFKTTPGDAYDVAGRKNLL